MEDNEEYREIKNVLLELAEEISSMTEGEKLLSLKKIVLKELKNNPPPKFKPKSFPRGRSIRLAGLNNRCSPNGGCLGKDPVNGDP